MWLAKQQGRAVNHRAAAWNEALIMAAVGQASTCLLACMVALGRPQPQVTRTHPLHPSNQRQHRLAVHQSTPPSLQP